MQATPTARERPGWNGWSRPDHQVRVCRRSILGLGCRCLRDRSGRLGFVARGRMQGGLPDRMAGGRRCGRGRRLRCRFRRATAAKPSLQRRGLRGARLSGRDRGGGVRIGGVRRIDVIGERRRRLIDVVPHVIEVDHRPRPVRQLGKEQPGACRRRSRCAPQRWRRRGRHSPQRRARRDPASP